MPRHNPELDRPYTALGRAIEAVRRQAGLTQVELAKKMRKHPTVLARYEQGVRQAPVNFLHKIQQVTGLKVEVGDAPPPTAKERHPEHHLGALEAYRKIVVYAQRLADEELDHVVTPSAGLPDPDELDVVLADRAARSRRRGRQTG